MGEKSQLGEFLRSRRARLSPQQAGLRHYGTRRRVPGLRREELAQLAGVSIDYYTRFERGKLDNVSPAVVDAVATALGLDDDERAHLHNLARPPRPGEHPGRPPLRAGLQQLLDSLDRTPAYVIGYHTEIQGWNRAAQAVFGIDFATLPEPERTWIHLVFLDERIRALTGADWPDIARQVVVHLRLRTSARPHDEGLTTLIDDMTARSADFRTFWDTQDVADVAHGSYHLRHPEAGDLHLDWELIPLTADPGAYAIMMYSARPGTPSHKALRILTDDATAPPEKRPS